MDIRIGVLALLMASAPLQAADPVGAVALVTGSVTANGASLGGGDPIFEGQTITVAANSYANLKFNDGGRVLLRPNSEFVVEKYSYAAPPAGIAAPQAAARGAAFFRLVRGGFRAITGLIGQADRQDYRVTTPAATIGIRGTDYEVQTCTTDCPERPARAAAGGVEVAASDLAGVQLAQAGGGQGVGVIVATNEGTVVLTTPRGEMTIDVGQVALAYANGETFRLPAVPDALLVHPATSPADCE